ncbi:MAG TPA: Rne/Rng family ribonuclease [Caulobacteraceae bacterium]|jgi:ribonuclease E
MPKMMLIDAAHAEETRVAVVDGTRIEEFDFESRARKQLRGNIYLAKVTRVEPSLQAAFIEYGGNRHGFLAFNEIHPDYYQIPLADREALLREEAEENERSRKNGNGHASTSSDAEAAEGEESAGEDDDDLLDEEVERRRRRLLRRYKIQEVIKRRQIMLVQVVKDERGAKGASLTTYLSLAGRYCVLMPNTARGGGVSRKIESATDRKRLKGVISSLGVPEGMGLIVRTAGAKRTKAEIKRDYDYLVRLWENIRETTMKSIAPALIYEEEDLVKRAVRDMYDKDVDAILVEGEEAYREARDFMRMIMPSAAKKVQPYRDPAPVFVAHKIEDSLSQIYSPVVPLRSGGYLVINQAEALVAIDVNSGKSTRERGIEATALKTNMEAAEEAARQLRLRDLAGLIVIDFIDMEEAKNNRSVEKKLKDCLKDDRARIQMGKISGFGLMELSRQRRRTGVLEGTTHVCAHCQGSGRVRSVESSALAALRAVEIEAARNGAGVINLKLAPDVALYVLNEKRAYLARLQETQGLFVAVQIDESIGHADHEIIRATREEALPPVASLPAPAPMPVEAEAEAEDDYEEEAEEDEDADEDEDDGAPERAASPQAEGSGRRRRRRRRGRRDEGPSDEAHASQQADRPEQQPTAETVDGESDASRRRRRGRRGGRAAPEARSTDPYGWTRARTPDGSDPYGWYDTAPPVDLEEAPPPAPANDEEPAPQTQPTLAEIPDAPVGDAQAAVMEDVWVELPAEPEKPKSRPRRGRGRADKAETAPAEAADGAARAAPLSEPAPAPAPADVVLEVETPTTVEAANEDAAPEPAAASAEPAPPPPPPEPDPAEILAPPEKPKRGWWRRGA